MPFPPETVGRKVRSTPASSQAGYQAPQSASAAGAALEVGGNLDALVSALAGVLSVKQSLLATDLSEVAVDFNTATTVSLVSATASQTTRVHKLFLVVGGTTNLTFQSASTPLHGILPMQIGGSFVLDFDERPWFTTAVNEALQLTSSAAVQVSGRIYYVKS